MKIGPALMARLDDITNRRTADHTFERFVEGCLYSPNPCYRPALYDRPCSGREADTVTPLEALECGILADAFDDAFEAAGDTRRAYRGR